MDCVMGMQAAGNLADEISKLNLSLDLAVSHIEQWQEKENPIWEYYGGNSQFQICWVVHHLLEEFVRSDEKTFHLEKNLSSWQKNYLLSVMQCMGLKVKYSRNEDAYLVKSSVTAPLVRMLTVSPVTVRMFYNFSKSPRCSPPRQEDFDYRPCAARTITSFTLGSPYVPKKTIANGFRKTREALPIYKHKSSILNIINCNQVTVIKGPAGVGKSTQIPQFLLEEAEQKKRPIRILSCVPESVAALSLCDRVALERGERVGYTVGYQVPLESCSSPIDTLLNFTTTSVLLRGLTIPGCLLLQTTTHIILDEFHCRQKYQDMFLLLLRDICTIFPNLKVIVIGEDFHIDFVGKYFEGVAKFAELLLPNNIVPPKIYYLEDILRFAWEDNGKKMVMYENMNHQLAPELQRSAPNAEVDEMIANVYKKNRIEEAFADFYCLLRLREIDVDYCHSETSLTMLMVACLHGRLDFVQTLLEFGASLNCRSKNNCSAVDWARRNNQDQVIDFLRNFSLYEDSAPKIAREYLRYTDPTKPDLRLILRLIKFVHVTDMKLGTIMVFLPSYENICQLEEMIRVSYRKDFTWGKSPIVVHLLHSHIQSGDHKSLFTEPKSGFRKLILSTNVGESCFTFKDVMYVIDSGKESDTYANAMQGQQEWNFQGHWISQAQAQQRTGRAKSVCYRIYTEQRHRVMPPSVTPEITYASLTDLILLARAMIVPNSNISEFMEFLPSPPDPSRVQEAVRTLKFSGAFGDNEILTPLGIHLMDFALEPQWAKAVIYSVIFKCLDPILTIAACMSYGNPFVFQKHPNRRNAFHKNKHELSGGTLSDHMAVLSAFHKWECERSQRTPEHENFYSENCISPWNFDIVYEIRSRLLGQLRASGFVHNKGFFDVKSLNKNSDNFSVVKALLVAALYPNICVADRISQTWFDRFDRNLSPETPSVLMHEDNFWTNLSTDWMVFDSKVRVDEKAKLKGCTLVSPLAVALLAGDFYSRIETSEIRMAPIVGGTGFVFTDRDRMLCDAERTKMCINIDNWIKFFSFNLCTGDLISLREQIVEIITSRLRKPQSYPSKWHERVLKTVVELLKEEDQKCQLKQASVGQWPKLVSGNLLSVPDTGFEITRGD